VYFLRVGAVEMAVKRQLAVAAAALALIGGGYAIWQLQPPGIPATAAQKLGELNGFGVYAVPKSEDMQGLEIRKDGKVVWAGPEGDFVRVELVSTDVDVGGGPKADIIAYGWTGGASCCLEYVAFSIEDGGKLLGTIPRQGGDTRTFVRSKVVGLPQAVLPSYDLSANGAYGSMAGSPLPRVFISHDGKRFALDAGRMKASAAEKPPAFWTIDPQLVNTIAQEALEDDFQPPAASASIDDAYAAWSNARIEAAASDELLDAADPDTFVTPALVLNEYVYKGQAAAGVAAVEKAFAERPGLATAIFKKYFTVLTDSQWLEDLDRMNDGGLKPLLVQYAAQ